MNKSRSSTGFQGYRRENGKAGTRNYIGILSTVVCANEVAEAIARAVPGTACFTHHQGCGQTQIDIDRVRNTLIGLGKNPNLVSVVLISLGCESTPVDEVAEAIAQEGKVVETLAIQKVGGAAQTIARGTLLAGQLVQAASQLKRSPCSVEEIMLGMKCGSSDTTSGLLSNPALGLASDLIVENGGTSVLGEVTEFIGAEHILIKQAKDDQVAEKIIALVERMESRAKSVGTDMRGGQPTMGNIKGGLSTIEEKSLGAIAKAGDAIIQGVYEYGEIPDTKGLVVMDSPGREPELLTGLAAAGCNVIAFVTGLGAPQGFPFVPVLKITGNRLTWKRLQDHMDLEVSTIIEGRETLSQAGQRIYEQLLEVASGKLTKAEISGYFKAMDIYTIGPVI